jgi:hypothetical protein
MGQVGGEVMQEWIDIAKRYAEAPKVLEQRRAAWERCVTEVLLPTLQKAADVLRNNGLPHAEADRHGFGKHLESVQLYTGQSDVLVVLDQGFAKRVDGSSERLVFEIGATLGYSINPGGQVMRWHREHWFNVLGPQHPAMIPQGDPYPDASAIDARAVEQHITEFLRAAVASSHRVGGGSRRPLGFASVDADVKECKDNP